MIAASDGLLPDWEEELWFCFFLDITSLGWANDVLRLELDLELLVAKEIFHKVIHITFWAFAIHTVHSPLDTGTLSVCTSWSICAITALISLGFLCGQFDPTPIWTEIFDWKLSHFPKLLPLDQYKRWIRWWWFSLWSFTPLSWLGVDGELDEALVAATTK